MGSGYGAWRLASSSFRWSRLGSEGLSLVKVLITGGASDLARAIARELAADHTVRLVDSFTVEVPESVEFVKADILDLEAAWWVIRGCDALIHTAEPPPGLSQDLLTPAINRSWISRHAERTT